MFDRSIFLDLVFGYVLSKLGDLFYDQGKINKKGRT